MANKKKCAKKRGKERKFSLKEQYKLSWNYIKESKNFIWLVVGFFVLSALIGFFVPAPESVVQKILEYIAELLEKTAGMSGLELTGFIFLNNLQSSFGVVIFGFIFGLVPIIATFVNGYVVGFVASISVSSEGILSLWRLLPHGIFELPAVFISLGMGLKFGDGFIGEYFKIKNKSIRILIMCLLTLVVVTLFLLLYKIALVFLMLFLFFIFVMVFVLVFFKKKLEMEFLKGLRVFVFVVLPLLIIGAIIEGGLISLGG